MVSYFAENVKAFFEKGMLSLDLSLIDETDGKTLAFSTQNNEKNRTNP